jgi:hypothetical protein
MKSRTAASSRSIEVTLSRRIGFVVSELEKRLTRSAGTKVRGYD